MLISEKVINKFIYWLNLILITYLLLLLSLEKRKNIQTPKLPNKRQKASIKDNDSEFQKRIQELEYEERKEELERKRLDNQLKKLEIARKEKELNE